MIALRERTAEVRREIDLGGGDSFTLILASPTWGRMVADAGGGFDIEKRIAESVVGWDGVKDSKSMLPVDFSLDNLKRLCEAYPAAFIRIIVAVNDLYRGETDRKNSGGP